MLSETLVDKINSLQTKALIIGILGVLVTLAGTIILMVTGWRAGSVDTLFQPFIVAYVLVLGMGVGCLAALMLHHLCGGAWSFMIQRTLEAASRTLPYIMGMGVLVILGGAWFSHVYPWTSEAYIHEFHIVEEKAAFLNLGVFTLAFFIYWALWLGLMFLYNAWSKRLDETGDQEIVAKMRALAGPGLIIYVLSITFAATHWTMSLEPEWFSTIYPAWLIAGYNITTICFATIVLTYLLGESPIKDKVTVRHLHHLGNFMLGFIIFWSYVSFSQFLLIWNANLPETIGWYVNRSGGGLTFVTVLLIVFHWFVPMMFLLIRKNKTNPVMLRRIAIYIMVVHIVDIYWNIVPSYVGHRGHIDWVMVLLVLTAVAGAFGLWLWLFLAELKKRPLLAVEDPRRSLWFLKDEAHSHA